MKRVMLQPAYILHRRLYRESSFLLEIFTIDYGRLTLIAKGVRKLQKAMPGLLQPFIPLLISWTGKHELMILTHVEMRVEEKGTLNPIHPMTQQSLRGDCLFAGFYFNELIMRLLQKWDPHTNLFQAYEQALIFLKNNKLEEKILRSFEKYLLAELGYGLFPNTQTFLADKYYRFIPEHGFVLSELGDMAQAKTNLFLGKHLLAIAEEDWQTEEILQDAKRLARLVLLPLLGQKPLYSRQLFIVPDEDVK